MKKLLILLVSGAIVVPVVVFSVSFVRANVPHLINYQGMLTDNSGNPLSGSYDLTFKIYNAESGGTKKWEETQSLVSVSNGLFNVILGSVTPINLNFSEDYWLDITVGAEQMPSRLKFTSVGYAYRAEKADTADYALSSPSGPGDYAWTFRITDTADTTISTGGCWGIARYGNILYGNRDSTHVNLGVACTTGASGKDYKYCTVGGGRSNAASERYTTVGGGNGNTATGYGATVGGGEDNTADTVCATVGGGYLNSASGCYAIVGGGSYNSADTSWATVGGGKDNTVSGRYATVGGGNENTASGSYATVGGGWDNTATGYGATVGGGEDNTADTSCAIVGGGYLNTASGHYATVGGGRGNTASGYCATVAGGYYNTASGNFSFAAGRRAKANHLGTFVWADSSVDADFASTDKNQFLIRASGGVGIGTNSPEEMLHVQNATEGMIKVGTPTANGNATVIFEEGNDDAIALRYDGSKNELRIDDETTANTRMVIERSGNVGIGTETPATKLAVLGLTPTSSYGYVKVNTATGAFYYSSSSKRYKEDVRPLEDDFTGILQAQPKSFIDKASGEREIGYIAEEFDGMGLNNLVIYDKEGRPDGLKYELVSLYLLEAMKDQAEMMKELETDNEKLRRRIEALEAR